MRLTAPLTLPQLAIAAGATSPVPTGGAGSQAWSTTLSQTVEFNGTTWEPIASGGAVSGPSLGLIMHQATAMIAA